MPKGRQVFSHLDAKKKMELKRVLSKPHVRKEVAEKFKVPTMTVYYYTRLWSLQDNLIMIKNKPEGYIEPVQTEELDEMIRQSIPTPAMSTGRKTLGTILEEARAFSMQCQDLWEGAAYRVKVLESFENVDRLAQENSILRERNGELEIEVTSLLSSTSQTSTSIEVARRIEAYKNANAGLMGDKNIR